MNPEKQRRKASQNHLLLRNPGPQGGHSQLESNQQRLVHVLLRFPPFLQRPTPLHRVQQKRFPSRLLQGRNGSVRGVPCQNRPSSRTRCKSRLETRPFSPHGSDVRGIRTLATRRSGEYPKPSQEHPLAPMLRLGSRGGLHRSEPRWLSPSDFTLCPRATMNLAAFSSTKTRTAPGAALRAGSPKTSREATIPSGWAPFSGQVRWSRSARPPGPTSTKQRIPKGCWQTSRPQIPHHYTRSPNPRASMPGGISPRSIRFFRGAYPSLHRPLEPDTHHFLSRA